MSTMHFVQLDGLEHGVQTAVYTILRRYPKLQITSTTGGVHAKGSLHYQRRAVDLAAPNTIWGRWYMRRAARWVRRNMRLTEGIFNPNLSMAKGRTVPHSYWGDVTWRAHANHLHIGV